RIPSYIKWSRISTHWKVLVRERYIYSKFNYANLFPRLQARYEWYETIPVLNDGIRNSMQAHALAKLLVTHGGAKPGPYTFKKSALKEFRGTYYQGGEANKVHADWGKP
ncbi:MAG: hypothetical protein ABEH43_01920, partial [Flavobacteriales bacterium]